VEESSAANAYGEESSAANAANAYVKLLACATFTSLHLDPGGYHSGTLALAQAGSHSHGFALLIHALSLKETIGHQHPLLLHSTAMNSKQHGNDGITVISQCSKFLEAPNLINHCCSTPCMPSKYLMIFQL